MGIGHLTWKESLITQLVAGGEEWSGASTRGAAEGGGQSDLAGGDSQVRFCTHRKIFAHCTHNHTHGHTHIFHIFMDITSHTFIT